MPASSPLPRINGGRPRTNEYLFDGISVLQPEPGQVAFFPVIDAIQEFKIESNSPPAEFGRFNGGVINLTTKSGANAFHGDGFEFFRNEALNARNYFQSTIPTKPAYRRNQFGGTAGGPLVRDHTFFFVDYQGQRQSIGRTQISVVPTLLQRQGIFTEAIGGRVPAIFDPASAPGAGRTQFPGNTIPLGRMDPIALALLQRYPLPTASGTSNNYSRTDNEIDDQDQWDVRLDHRFSNRDQAFGRLTYFRDGFIPVTPLPDGSGSVTGTLGGPQDTTAWSFASNYQHVFSTNLLNEVRVGDTRRTVGRTAAQLDERCGRGAEYPGHPLDGKVPEHAADVRHRRLSAAGLADQHGLGFQHERVGGRRLTELGQGTSFAEDGPRLAVGTAQRHPAAVSDGQLRLQQPVQRSARHGQHGDAAREFSAGAGPDVLHRPAAVADPGTRAVPGVLHPGRLESLRPADDQSWIALHAEFSIHRDQRPDRGVQPADAAAGYPGDNPVRPLKKNNWGPRLGIVYRATDKTVLSTGYGLVWIEMAGITTPFTTPTFPFLQTVSQRTLDNLTPAFTLRNGPSVAPIAPTPTAGLGQGVFAVDGTLGSGYVQQWNASVQRELTPNTSFEVAYVGSHIVHVGIPDSNVNQLSVDQLALGATLLQNVPNPFFGIIPRSSNLGNPTIPRAQLLKPFPEYGTVSIYRNNVGTTFYQGLELSLRQRLSRGLQYSIAYTRSKLMDDASSVFDASILTGPLATFQVADGFNRGARARLLEWRHAACLRVVHRLGSADGIGPGPAGARRRSAPSSTTGM